MKKGKIAVRKSNMELLRILAMVLIIINHIFFFAIMEQLKTGLPGEYFNYPIYFPRLTLAEFSLIFGKIGNTIFILLTGYFLIDSKNIDIGKSSKKLITQIIYIIITLVFASAVFAHFSQNFRGLITIRHINTCGWFAGYYILVVLMAKLFVNKFLNKLNQKEFLSVLIVAFALVQINWSRDIINMVFPLLIVNGLFIYSVGAYIKKFNPFKNIKSIFLILMIFAVFAILAISYRNNVITNIRNVVSIETFHHVFERYDDWAFASIVSGICLFELFTRINIRNSKIINYIASTTFLIFILHDNSFTYYLLNKINWVKPYHDNLFEFFGLMMLAIFIIFAIGSLLYYIYCLILKYINSRHFKNLIYKK